MKGQNVGYIRVSTLIQNTERQLDGVELDTVFEEKCSAKTIDRPELEACKKHCRQGDTLHIHSIDRVCRSGVDDLVNFVNEMLAKGVTIRFHKDGFEFNGDGLTATQEGLLSILASVSKMERGLIEERRKEGQAIAAAEGRKPGRRGLSDETVSEFKRLRESGLSVTKAAKELNIGRSTAYRIEGK
ncbi:recombinase family protein [Vibrio hannami]|uniref:recombinase family protein n=1 Tax=Vibrio hannami TaxID=2717094 RepID=UPI00240F6F42|nr:recombinase family protein [Vibrio hannami]MDG3089146.1 recombinase family protein [Vibrio hannami]